MLWRIVSASLALSSVAMGVELGQVDTFSTGTTLNWREGAQSPNPPTVSLTGGPAGDGDAFLRNRSSGSGGAGGRQVVINQLQWSGDYLSAGVSRIEADMINLGVTTLYMRLAINGNFSVSNFGSSNFVELAPGTGWQRVNFDLTPAGLTDLSSQISTLEQVLGNVNELRILSARDGPSFIGDRVNGTLGIDNIRATVAPEPSAGLLLLAACLLRRGRVGRGGPCVG